MLLSLLIGQVDHLLLDRRRCSARAGGRSARHAGQHQHGEQKGNATDIACWNGSTLVSRVVATGYSYSQLAENLAAGPISAQDVVAGWMNSSGHRANILNCGLHELGIGYYVQLDDQSNVRLDNGQLGGPYRYYWTQDFGSQ